MLLHKLDHILVTSATREAMEPVEEFFPQRLVLLNPYDFFIFISLVRAFGGGECKYSLSWLVLSPSILLCIILLHYLL